MPHLEALQDKYRESGLSVIGVNVDGVSGETIRAQLPRLYGKVPNYTLVPDEELKVADLYKMTAAPLSVIVDREGKIVYSHEGYKPGDEKELEGRIEKQVAR
jgi:thiol-disulfide isomerase/thioredoxin